MTLALREYVDPSRVEWQVWHVVPTTRTATPPVAVERRKRADPHYPGDRRRKRFTLTPAMESGWLCFESAGEKRRLVPVPEDWEVCSEARLRAYLEAAQPVSRRIVEGAGPDHPRATQATHATA